MSRAAAVAAVRFTLYMAVNFCYSDTTSAIFFSITQAKRKRDPKSACEDIRYSAKANNKGCRHMITTSMCVKIYSATAKPMILIRLPMQLKTDILSGERTEACSSLHLLSHLSKPKALVSGNTHSKEQLNHYANQHNPNNSAYQANRDNRSNQCNPNNKEYDHSRGSGQKH